MAKGYVKSKIATYIKRSYFEELETTKLSIDEWIAEKTKRCNAKSRTGKQCVARAINNTDKCHFHGGESTGPKTEEGRRKSLSKLAQFRNNPEKLEEYLAKEK